jgi:hypothetical protein
MMDLCDIHLKISEKTKKIQASRIISSFPLSIFDNNCILRNSNKLELAKEIATRANYDPGTEKKTTQRKKMKN